MRTSNPCYVHKTSSLCSPADEKYPLFIFLSLRLTLSLCACTDSTFLHLHAVCVLWLTVSLTSKVSKYSLSNRCLLLPSLSTGYSLRLCAHVEFATYAQSVHAERPRSKVCSMDDTVHGTSSFLRHSRLPVVKASSCVPFFAEFVSPGRQTHYH